MAAILILTDPVSAETEDDGPLIDSVVIDNRNIFNLDSSKYDWWPFKLANKIHIRTKKFIIRREILLEKGQRYSQELADETERNLRSLSYLWDARIDLIGTEDGKNLLKVTTNDRWTLKAGISPKRNAGLNTIHFYVEESNLFGLGQLIAFNYYYRDYDKNFFQFNFIERRLFGSRYLLDVYYNQDPEVGVKGFVLGRPYFSLDADYAFTISLNGLDSRRDHYKNGLVDAQYKTKGRWFEFFGGYRFGDRINKIRLGLELQHKKNEVYDAVRSHDSEFAFPSDSNYIAVVPEFGIDHFSFIKARRIRSFGLIDDIILHRGGTIGAGVAFDERGRRLYNEVFFRMSYDFYYKSNFLFVRGHRRSWFYSGIEFRKSGWLSIIFINNRLRWVTPVIRAVYAMDKREDGTPVVYLGENLGLRGYARNEFTGEKKVLINFENRFFTGLELFSVQLGLAQFLDMGQVQGSGEKTGCGKFYRAVGFGLRFGTEKIASSRVARLDFAYGLDNKNWQVSFGLGQYVDL